MPYAAASVAARPIQFQTDALPGKGECGGCQALVWRVARVGAEGYMHLAGILDD